MQTTPKRQISGNSKAIPIASHKPLHASNAHDADRPMARSAPVRSAPPPPPPRRGPSLALVDPPPIELPPSPAPFSMMAAAANASAGGTGNRPDSANVAKIARSMLLSTSCPPEGFMDQWNALNNSKLEIDTKADFSDSNLKDSPASISPTPAVQNTPAVVKIPAALPTGGSGIAQSFRKGLAAAGFGNIPPPITSQAPANTSTPPESARTRRESAGFQDDQRFSLDNLSKSPTVFSMLKTESPPITSRSVRGSSSSRATGSRSTSLRVPDSKQRSGGKPGKPDEDELDLQFAISLGDESMLDEASPKEEMVF